MEYHRSRFVGGPKLDTPSTAERANTLQLRLAQLRADRQQSVEDLAWDRVGSDD
jgi:hypothetical protein